MESSGGIQSSTPATPSARERAPLSRQQKEELLRRAAAARSAGSAVSRITARARKRATPPDVERLSDAQVEQRLERLLAGSGVPRSEQIRRELPRLGPQPKRLLLGKLMQAVYRGTATARISYAQQRSWFLQSLAPDSAAQNIAAAVHARGALDVRLLERCFNIVIGRHEALRTNFPVIDGEPTQFISSAREISIVEHEFRHLPQSERQEAAMRGLLQEAYRPFDLASGSLLRVNSFEIDPADRLLLLTMHHIIGDEWSIGVLLEELGALYASNANPAALAPLPLQYADYCEWEGESLTPESMKRHLAYWKEKLAGADFQLEVPPDRPRPEVQTTNGALEPLLLSRDARDGLMAIARGEQATMFMAMLAGFNVLLAAWTGRRDILVGTDFASRSRPEIARLIGFFVNELVFRTDLSDNPSFRELLRRVRRNSIEVYQHQDLPFQWLVEELKPPRDRSRTPLFQVVFDLHNIPLALNLQGITLMPMRLPLRPAKFDLTLFISETPKDTWALLEYNTDLYDRATAQRLLSDYHALIARVVADPDRRVFDLAVPIGCPAG